MGSWPLVLPYLQQKEGGRSLDIGCADGLYLQYLGKNAVGIEQVQSLAEKARAGSLNVIVGDVCAVIKSFTDKEFDTVLFSHVMEHLDCPIGMLREIWRVLKPKGVLVIGLPIERNIYRDLLRMNYFNGTHIYAFTVRNAIKLLKEVNFEPVKVIFHLPKFRGRFGAWVQRLWNVTHSPFHEYFSMAYWIVAEKPPIDVSHTEILCCNTMDSGPADFS